MQYAVWLGLGAGALVLSLATIWRGSGGIPENAGAAASVMAWGVVAIGATDLEKITNCCVVNTSNLPAAILAGAFGGYMLLYLFNSIFELWQEETPANSAGENNLGQSRDRARRGGGPR